MGLIVALTDGEYVFIGSEDRAQVKLIGDDGRFLSFGKFLE